jgi:hypothetical protein
MKAVDKVGVCHWGSVNTVIAVAVVVIVKEWRPVLIRRLLLFPSNRELGRCVRKWPVTTLRAGSWERSGLY